MSLFDHRFTLFSGKGGVGKTTIASAFALACARRGQRTLLIQLDVKEKVSSFFGSETVSTDIIEVEDNLFAVNITPDAALEEYGLLVLKVRLIYKAVFENRLVQTFLRAIPGLNDLLMLGKAHYHATERDDAGEYLWDKVVVDAPATGHGIFFLQIPSVITSLLTSGRMYDEALKIEAFLQDPTLTSINLVTLPEDMPVNETLMLRDVIRDRLQIPVYSIVANALVPPLFAPSQSPWLAQADLTQGAPKPLKGLLEAAAFRHTRVALQQEYLEHLQHHTAVPILEMPYYFAERITFPIIEAMAQRLTDEILSVDQRPGSIHG